jgi:stage V sporulation protein SpoVS
MSYKRLSPQPIIEGGTNTQSFTHAFGVAYYDGGALNNIDPGLNNYVLTSNGSSAPSFQAVSASGAVTTVDGNSGSAAPSSGVLTISGSGPITTSGTSATISITTTAANTLTSSSGTATASSNNFNIVGAGTVTTSATGATLTITGGASGIAWNNVTSATQAMAINNGYISNDGATLVTMTLPATAAIGSIVQVQGAGSGLWTIAQNALQSISFNSVTSTVGTGGSVSSTSQYDSITLICITANTTWAVNQSTGNLSVV